MERLKSIFTASVIVCSATLKVPAYGQAGNPALTETPVTTGEIMRSYEMGPHQTPRDRLDDLDKLCESRKRSNQKRCDTAWRKINVAYAKLQAAKVAGQSQAK